MIEKVYFIYTEQGYIGTITWLEVDDKIFALADIYGIFVDNQNVFLETEIHFKNMFDKPRTEDEVLNSTLSQIIKNYDARVYLWNDITTSQFNPHRK
jgi:hypothetical protein